MFDYEYDPHTGGTASATFSDLDISKDIVMDGSDLTIQSQDLQVTSHTDEDPDSSAVFFTTKDGTPVAVFMGTAIQELFISFDNNSASVVFDIPPLMSLLDYEGDFVPGEEAQGYAGTISMTLTEGGSTSFAQAQHDAPVATEQQVVAKKTTGYEVAPAKAEQVALGPKLAAAPQPLMTVQGEDLQDVDTEAVTLAVVAESLMAPQVEEAPQSVFTEVAELDVVEESLGESLNEVEDADDESSASEQDPESAHTPVERASDIFYWM
ncbi:MAG: hypothetical protein ACTJLK_03505 [Anaplasma sp.]